MSKNIFQRMISSSKQKGTHIVRAPFTASILGRFNTGNYSGALQNKDYLDEYRNWVYPCVDARMEGVGNIKLKLMKGDEQIFEHPMLDVLAKVNDGMTQRELFKATQAFKDLHGNAFWYLARTGKDGTGDIAEIYILKPNKVRIVLDKANPLLVSGYLYTQPDGSIIPFSPDEILHHKNFNPKGNHPFPHLGMGVVEASAYAIDTDNSAREWNLNFFRNGARPDGLLITDGEGASDSADFKRLKEEWNEEHGGASNAHKISVLSGGLKYQELTRTQKDMDFAAQRTMSRDEILAMFKVPRSIIGITDDVNRANAEASLFIFALLTIQPLMEQLVDTLNEFFIPEFGETGMYFTFVSPVPDDRAARVAEYVAGKDKWLSTNDIRRAEGMPVTPEGEALYVSNAVTKVDSTPVPDTSKSVKGKNNKPVEKKVENKSAGAQAVDAFIAKMPESKAVKALGSTHKSLNEKQRADFIGGWVKRHETNTQPLKRKLRDYFAKQEKEVQKNLRDEMKGLEAPEFKYKSVSDILFDTQKQIAIGISLVTPFLAQYLKESGQVGLDATGATTTFDATATAVAEFQAKRAKYFADSINQTTSDDLMSTIQDGMDNAESLDQISKRISDVYQQAQDYRTDMTARTEVAASSNFGLSQGYLQGGVQQQQWVVVDPDDADCLDNEGEVVDIGNSFASGDSYPPIHPNCMCTVIPVIDVPSDSSEE